MDEAGGVALGDEVGVAGVTAAVASVAGQLRVKSVAVVDDLVTSVVNVEPI